MSRATFTLFDDNRRVYQSALPEAGTNDLLVFSGVLDRPISVEDVRTARTLWVCVGSRSAEVKITITYQVAGVQIFLVTPGRPMVLETLSGAVDTLLSIIVEPTARSATVEILVYPGFEIEPPTLPTDYVLHLNAAGGIETDDLGRVDSWEDDRILATTGPFIPVTTNKPLFIESHSDFNNQPTVQFSNVNDMRLVSTDAASVFDFLGTGPFTVAMVCSYLNAGTEQQGLSNESPGSGGFMLGVDPAFRTTHKLTDDGGAANNENTIPQELALVEGNPFISRAIVHIIRYDGTATVVYRQGREATTIDVGSPATAVAALLTLGASPTGGSLAGVTIADLRIWPYALEDEGAQAYIDISTEQYGVDNTEAAQAPLDAMFSLNAGRGTTVVDGFVTLWEDARPEITLGAMGPTPGRELPRRINFDSDFNQQPSMDFTEELRDTGMTYTGDAEDFNLFLGVDSLFTLMLVFVSDEDAEALRLMVAGGSPTNNGIRIQGGALILNTSVFTDGGDANMSLDEVMPVGVPRVIQMYPTSGLIPMEGLATAVRGGGEIDETSAEMDPEPEGIVTVPWRLGSQSAGSLSMAFRMVELRIYPRLLSDAERSTFMDYVAERYNMELP